MWFSRVLRLGASTLLGLFVPRSEANPAGGAGDDATELERVNARLKELETMTEEKIQAAADRRIYEIFPEVQVPTAPSRGPSAAATRDDDDNPPGEVSIDERFDALHRQVEDITVDRMAERLERNLDQLATKYPNMDRFKVLGQLAQAGNARVDIDKLAANSHRSETAKLDAYHQRKLAEQQAQLPPSPPPIPPNPAGAASSTPPQSSAGALAGATRKFFENAKAKLGWS